MCSTHTHTRPNTYVRHRVRFERRPYSTVAVAFAVAKKAPLFFPFCVTASKSKWAQGAEPTTTAASFKGGWVKIKQYPLAETANYHVWSLLEYLMIFFLQATKKCPGVIGLHPWAFFKHFFIEVTAASPKTSIREVKQATIVCNAEWF